MFRSSVLENHGYCVIGKLPFYIEKAAFTVASTLAVTAIICRSVRILLSFLLWSQQAEGETSIQVRNIGRS